MGLAQGDPDYKEDPGPKKGRSEYMLYNGTKVGFSGALPARRLKLWRDAVNDYEYYAMAKAKNPSAAQAVIEKMTYVAPLGDAKNPKISTIAANNNPEDYQAARNALAAIALGQKVENSEVQGRSKEYSPASAADKTTGYD